jgi:hypothetical protein
VTLTAAVRLILAGVAATGTLIVGRVLYARERHQLMSASLSVAMGLLLLAVYSAIAFSV